MSFEVGNGTMPARGFDWDSVGYPPRPVRDFARLHYGKALREPDRRPGSVPVFGTNGPCGWHDEPLAEGPGVILGRKGQGHLGVKWCRESFWVIDTAYYAEINRDEADLRWFYYITEYVGLDHLKTGEKPGLNRDVFGRQVFPFPPLEDQRAIVRILGMLDDKIELNRQMNATLEGMARALFKSWFVDFDPVTAKVAERQPFGMSSDIAALFPDSFDDTPIGPIPAGWSVGTVADLVQYTTNGGTPRRSESEYWVEGTIPWLTSSEVRDGIIVDTRGRITELGLANSSAKYVPAGSTVVALYGATAGQVAYIDAEMTTNQACCSLVPRETTTALLYCLMRESTEELERQARGAAQQNISKQIILDLPAVIPSEEALRAFELIGARSLDLMSSNVSESRELAHVRDALLPQLLSGEIRLRDAENLVEEVA